MFPFPYGYIPYPSTGRPLSNGSLYYGEAGTDPTVAENQITVYAVGNNGSLTAVSQPISVGSGGTPIYNASSVQLRITETEYSFVALDQNDSEVYNESYVYND